MARRKASGWAAQIAFICTTEALWIKSLFSLVAIVSESGDEGGGATSYADEMLIRRKVNEVWTRTNQPGGGQCGNEEAAASPPLFILRSFSPSLILSTLTSSSLFSPSHSPSSVHASFSISHSSIFLSYTPSILAFIFPSFPHPFILPLPR